MTLNFHKIFKFNGYKSFLRSLLQTEPNVENILELVGNEHVQDQKKLPWFLVDVACISDKL